MVGPQSAAYVLAITPPGNRPHSIAVFGCTGNAGRAVAYQIIKSAAKNRKDIAIALSGRNRDKIEQVLHGIKDELQGEGLSLPDKMKIDIVVADASDRASMLRLAKCTNILVRFLCYIFLHAIRMPEPLFISYNFQTTFIRFLVLGHTLDTVKQQSRHV